MKVNEFNPKNFNKLENSSYIYCHHVIATFENFKFYFTPYRSICVPLVVPLVENIMIDNYLYRPYLVDILTEDIIRLCKYLENIKTEGKNNKYYNLSEIFYKTINKNNYYIINQNIYAKHDVVYLDLLKKSDVYKTVFAIFKLRLKEEYVTPEEIKASKLLELVN